MNEELLQKAVEDVRENGGILKLTINIDAEKHAKGITPEELKSVISAESVGIFDLAYKILEAYKKKYGGKNKRDTI